MSEPGRADQQANEQDISPLALGNVVLRNRGLVARSSLLFVAAAILYLAVRTVDYSAESRFVPEVPAGNVSQLAGLAAQFGIRVGARETGAPLEFYAGLLTTRELLRETAISHYRFTVGQGQRDTLKGTIVDLYRVKGKTEESRVRRAIRLLMSQVSTRVDLRAGTVSLSVTARWPALAEQINRRLLDQVNEFNLEKRQTLAAAERRFTENRLQEAHGELQAAEAELERFLEQNREYQNSPRLAFDASRLQRRVDLRQEVYTTLAQAYEQARMNEVRDTPVITVVEAPERSARPGASGPIRIIVLALAVGGMFGVGLAFGREYVDRQRRRKPEDYAEFRTLSGITLRQLALGRLWGRPKT